MKALSINEPHASRILRGEKTIELRDWKTNHRGKLLLCATKKHKSNISGKAFAIADLVDCRPMKKEDEKKACYPFSTDKKSWILNDIQRINPFPVKGKPGLFDVDYRENEE